MLSVKTEIMQLTRTLNVITMACLLFLTGCFGITGGTSDQVWSVGDGVTIKEASAMCAAGETCSVTVTITDTQQGKTLDESSAVAE